MKFTKADKLPKGIRITGGRYQAYVRVNGRLKTKTFPLGTMLVKMQHWREGARVALREGTYTNTTGTTLAVDAQRYLALVEGMTTFDDREYHIDQWVNALGHRPRASIQPFDIQQQLELWRKTGSSDGGPLAPATLNLRRTALQSLYTTLDGKHMPNPVRGVAPYREEELPLDLPTHDEAQRAIAALWPRKYRPTKRPPLTQARLWVLYWTGWPSSTLKRVEPRHIDEARMTVLLHGRRKGGGTKPHERPVSPQAMAALKLLKKLGGLGDFDGPGLNHALKRGCDAATPPVRHFRVYDLRHLFGTTLSRHSKDERGVSELMGHADPRQTRRYTRHAASERARSTLAEALIGFPEPAKPPKKAVQLSATSRGRSRALAGRTTPKKRAS